MKVQILSVLFIIEFVAFSMSLIINRHLVNIG